jgi:hypothetical protein
MFRSSKEEVTKDQHKKSLLSIQSGEVFQVDPEEADEGSDETDAAADPTVGTQGTQAKPPSTPYGSILAEPNVQLLMTKIMSHLQNEHGLSSFHKMLHLHPLPKNLIPK